MGITINSNLGTILQAIENKLIDDGVFTSSTVFMSLTPEVNTFPASDHFGVICPGRQSAEQPMITGGGNDLFSIIGQVLVVLWVRLALDQVPRDEAYLTDPSLGILARLSCVLASLQLFFPADSDGNFIMSEPFRLLDVDTPKRGGYPGWGYLVSTWEVKYTHDLICNPLED